MDGYQKLGLWIDGEWTTGGGREVLAVLNPATGEKLADLPRATTADLDAALGAADRGFRLWKAISAYDRAKVLRRAADIMRERDAEIGRTLTLEQGKPLAEAIAEVRNSADIFEWFAEEGRRAYGRIVPARSATTRQMVVREPVGPVGLFTPWNFPASMPAKKIAAALAAGCSCVVKPSESTPGTCLALAQALHDAGLPAGVLNVVFGRSAEVSAHIIGSPVIRKISFTGSTEVGKHLAGLAALGAKRATMELGGHAPVIVFDDVDVDRVADLAVASKFRNAGQVCVSPTRFFVQQKVYDRFAQGFAERASKLRVGDGLAADTQMGPLANARRLDALAALTSDAVNKGAKLLTGGERIGNRGYFWQPTVLGDVPDNADIMQEEPFGPVVPIVPFGDADEVLGRANNTAFGLASYVFTNAHDKAMRIADGLEAGMVGHNTFNVSLPEAPFGGVKESGYGSEGGSEGLEPYLVTKFINSAATL
ncbi:MAG: NAD-dependent succinate-semialdehyde dehydrogenase [Hyphomicrobiales bacterium]|nr:MAG: NAD-dependent succinate-semialdehyde dehydrogenase [Hyphomicrobiales bacterium]